MNVRQSIVELAATGATGHHPGLLLQRYLAEHDHPGKRRALLDAAVQAVQSESLRAIYDEAFARWTGSFPREGIHQAKHLVTAARLVVGLGSESVLETGLRLHHTYGVPIIPGSALKGLASHYCHDVWGQRQLEAPAEENRRLRRDGTYHRLLFGTTDDGGVITFHDAWLTPASLGDGALRLDVMTPHHPKWQINEAPPTDFDNPVPVSFLSVAGTFEVRLSWSGPAAIPSDQAESWTSVTMTIVEEALAEWGVGGKTSSGYGRLVCPESPRIGTGTASVSRGRQVALPAAQDIVEARLLEERTRKGGWKARHEPSDLVGPIHNSGDVPADMKAGDTLKLIVASANEREVAFRYATAADEERVEGRACKARGKPGGEGRRGRRK